MPAWWLTHCLLSPSTCCLRHLDSLAVPCCSFLTVCHQFSSSISNCDVQGRTIVTLPLRRGRQKSAHISTLTIVKRFEFQSHLLRSGVAVIDSARPNDILLFIRGAPSSIEQVIGHANVPLDFHQVSVHNPSGILDAWAVQHASLLPCLMHRQYSTNKFVKVCSWDRL